MRFRRRAILAKLTRAGCRRPPCPDHRLSLRRLQLRRRRLRRRLGR